MTATGRQAIHFLTWSQIPDIPFLFNIREAVREFTVKAKETPSEPAQPADLANPTESSKENGAQTAVCTGDTYSILPWGSIWLAVETIREPRDTYSILPWGITSVLSALVLSHPMCETLRAFLD